MKFFAVNLFDGDGFSVLVERIGWVLIHSLWQFLLLAALLVLAERMLSKRSAAIRYLVSSVAFSAMLAAAVATFFLADVDSGRSEEVASIPYRGFADPGVLLISEDVVSRTDRVRNVMQEPVSGPIERDIVADEYAEPAPVDSSNVHLSIVERFTALKTSASLAMRPWLPACVFLWLIGMMIAAIRLVAGGIHVRHLRSKGVSPVPESVVALLASTASRLGLRRSVEILQSSLVAGPIVVGWLRPLILLPASSLIGLTTQQLEAVLAHELAHIRRLDFLVNLLQTITETIFFYHPAIWWTSRRMRIHREDCCDDHAISIVSTRLTYASALLALHELNQGERKAHAPAAALSATGGSLKKRIHRVLGLPDPIESSLNWWISTAFVGMFVLVIGGYWMTQEGLSDDKFSTGRNERDEDQTPLTPMPDPLNASAAELPVPLPPANTPEERERVLKQLEPLGVLRLDALDIAPEQPPGTAPLVAHLWDVPDAAWTLLGRLPTIYRLDVTASRVSPEAFRHVAGLKSLIHFLVVNSHFEPQHLESLATLTQLKSIDVMLTIFERTSEERQTQLGKLSAAEQIRFDAITGAEHRYEHIAEAAILTDRAVQKLSGLKRLETLKLVNTFVSNSGVLALNEMKGLTEIELSIGGRISRNAADVLGRMEKLEKLILLGEIDASAAAGLIGTSSLKELELRSIDDAVAEQLAEISSLEKLRLWSNSLSDEGLLHLAKLEHLKQVDIRFAHAGTLTIPGIEQFQSTRPGCSVQHDLRLETLSERTIPLPPDLFLIRLYWRKATSRDHLVSSFQKRFGDSEHWVEFRPLTRTGYVGGLALVRGTAGRDWLQTEAGSDADLDVAYSEPLTYQRLKEEGVFFDALLTSADAATARKRPAESEAAAGGESHASLKEIPEPESRNMPPIVLPGESLPPFPDLITRLRERGHGETANGLGRLFDDELNRLSRYPRAVVVYGQIVAESGDPPWLCNAPMRIFEGGWFVAGIRDKDRPVGFRMFGCRPVDVIVSQRVPGVRAGATVSLDRVVMTPYAPNELATVRGRLKFAGDAAPKGLRAVITISGGQVNSLTGGTDGFLEWPEKENVTLAEDLQFEHRQLAPLPHRLHIEAPGFDAVIRELDLASGATLDLGSIEISAATEFLVEFLASDTPEFTNTEVRHAVVRKGETWKSNPDNEALAKYPGGDMRFIEQPVDVRKPDGPEHLIIRSGVASLKLADLGAGFLNSFQFKADETPPMKNSRDVTIENGHAYLCYHTHWKHWTLLRVTMVE